VPGVAVVADLDQPLPFVDGAASEIVAVHFLGHV
jgi:hypothetical protein